MQLRISFCLVSSLVAASLGCEKDAKRTDAPEVGTGEGLADKVAAADQAPPPWLGRRSPEPGFPCEVETILERSCRRCHWEPTENDAPFGMVRFEDIQAMRSGKPISVLMKQMLEANLMPPLDALVTPKVTPLDPRDKETLLAWLKADAPRSSERCEAPAK